jgi:hypothetical protein
VVEAKDIGKANISGNHWTDLLGDGILLRNGVVCEIN